MEKIDGHLPSTAWYPGNHYDKVKILNDFTFVEDLKILKT